MLGAPQTLGQAADGLVHEPEEPPDENKSYGSIGILDTGFTKHVPTRLLPGRRESLLTRQLQPREVEDTQPHHFTHPVRALSSSSVAELTSDNDLTSPGTRASTPSPPLPPLRSHELIPPLDKHIVKEPVIAGHDERVANASDESEHKVESGLGRRRCITFACGKKSDPGKQPSNIPAAKEDPKASSDMLQRKCTITFNCPIRAKLTPSKPLALSSRHLSPAPKLHKSPKSPKSPRRSSFKSRRGSDMTITTVSPVALRKMPSMIRKRNKYAEAADEEKLEAKRFHEFAVNSRADEEWTEESTCHRKPLTIKDTLYKENVIRQIGEEVAEEEEEEDADLDDDALLDDLDVEDDDDDEDVVDDENEDDNDEAQTENTPQTTLLAGDSISDGGFDTDDEQGFANSSDSDGDDSDFEWWAPGRSTAATSTDQIEHIRSVQRRRMSDSSLESAREANGTTLKSRKKSKSKTRALRINRPSTPELPDSTDFVCGTLDEDRPLEQAYKTCIEQRKAAKHKVTPQDIDPTFPTSDPEMDEEDEEDEVEAEEEDEDDQQLLMHGPMDFHEERGRRNAQRSTSRNKSPSPHPLKSPAPVQRIHHRSPAPTPRRRSLRSPPPPSKCNRHRSPAPHHRPKSPPNSRRSSVEGTPRPSARYRQSDCLGSRPVPTRVSSLPRVSTNTKLQTLAELARHEDDEDDNRPRRSRGAIDIVKGLEKKRQRRKEKLYQKHCQKLKKEGERKPKPGKGAERMRELGLELAAYRGKKAEHMLSI
ncbi:hypothetical protein ANO11243_006020 [Dothideomycetidae sp. 11243]|nr:hypothetical protein ANO11243_006020 [fungal sp. No.11243]